MATDPIAIDRSALVGASRSDLIALAKNIAKAKETATKVGPQTDDELHAFIVEKWGINVPRVAVTPGFDAPFDYVADIYFERIESALIVGGRETAKTMNVALINALNAIFKPGYWAISAGAIDEQSRNAYKALMEILRNWGSELVKGASLQSKTEFKNRSLVEVKGGTRSQLNGPHSNSLHRDEIELFDRAAFDEGDNITKSGVTTDGRPIKAVDILTTSRKFAKGLLQELLDECDKAEKAGRKPPHRVYKVGVAETVKRVPNCRGLPENQGKPDAELCDCNQMFKGTWDDGTDRTLEQVCDGRFGRSDGWRPLDPDIKKKFLTNSRFMWEAQQECMRPAGEGLILASFKEAVHVISSYDPNPEYGRIYQSTDFGGGNPHAANWYQHITVPVTVKDFYGDDKVLPAGSLICFAEVYVTEIGNMELAALIVAMEEKYKAIYGPSWEVEERYADVANRAARIDFRNYDPPLRTTWRVTREIEEHITKCQGIVNDKSFYVLKGGEDGSGCPMFIEEAEAWQRDPATGKQIDTFNHCCGPDEMVQIRGGLRRAADLEGQTVEVLTHGGEYRPAKWRSYGERELWEVEFDDESKVLVTDGHEWVVKHPKKKFERVKTTELEGRFVPTQPSIGWEITDIADYVNGVRNGLVYGDGTKFNVLDGRYQYSILRQYGDENCALVEEFFPDEHRGRRPSPHLGEKIETGALDAWLKDLPNENASPDYLRGFVAGYFAADGCVSKQGACTLGTAKEEDIEQLTKIFRSVGVVVTKVRKQTRKRGSGYGNGDFYVFNFTRESFDRTLLLKPGHNERNNKPHKIRHTRKVVAVRPTGIVSEVFCCDEPVTHTFVLGSGVLTGNCMSNFRYAVANIDRKLQIERRKGIGGGAGMAVAVEEPSGAGKLPDSDLPNTGPVSTNYNDDEQPFGIPLHRHGPDNMDKMW